jgi:hypothetical protein
MEGECLMIERFILKEKFSLDHLKVVLAAHPDWEYVVSEYPAAWHIKLDRGGETLDDELLEYETYPDVRASYLVEVVNVDAKNAKVRIKRGKHERSINDDLNVATKKKVGDKAMLAFLEADRSKPIIIG